MPLQGGGRDTKLGNTNFASILCAYIYYFFVWSMGTAVAGLKPVWSSIRPDVLNAQHITYINTIIIYNYFLF